MKGHRAWGVTALVLAAIVVGCGGSEDGDEASGAAATVPTTPGLSKEELIDRADAICDEVIEQVKEEERRGEEFSPEEEAGQAAAFYSVMVAQLKELGAPEDADGYSEFFAAAEKLRLAENEYDRALEFDDNAKLPSLNARAASALASFRDTAREYGSEECSEVPSPPDLSA